MNPIDLETARRLIDYSGGTDSLKPLAETQIQGATALQNMIADPAISMGYLADEVGMGKTYIALGVVAMLRYFNPMLRVLYICPSRNVQEKWQREYQSFIRSNVRVNQGRIRNREGQPAAPFLSCRNVAELLHGASSGYYADYFIGKDSFSMGLSDDQTTLRRKRDELRKLVPAHEWKGAIGSKHDVKEQYARALNYILPTFDLVVIDEAHNFKHDFESSDRNRVLSGVLGFRDVDGYVTRARHALLLSATPYDRNLNQLRNQLAMVGRMDLLPEDVDEQDQPRVRECLGRFMVRRLNRLPVNGRELTRNMYRREWRKGDKAEISLEKDEQKLVTALVQKKVGEMFARQTESPSFQTGLLASFESFAESAGSQPVIFDGDNADKEQTDARDRNIIGRLADSYVEHGLGRALPHPKMDTVVKRRSAAMFDEAKKQLLFVRRVKSVNELKHKFDDAYNDWIKKHIEEVLSGHKQERLLLDRIFQRYRKVSSKRDDETLGGEIELEAEDDAEVSIPAKSDTFYAWFFRGETLSEIQSRLNVGEYSYPTPDAVRIGLAAKSQVLVNLLEPNWAWYVCRYANLDLDDLLKQYGDEIAKQAGHYISGRLAEDNLEVFQACQTAFVRCVIDHHGAAYLEPLYNHMAMTWMSNPVKNVSRVQLDEQLRTPTLYTELEQTGLAEEIIPYQKKLWVVFEQGGDAADVLTFFDIHQAMLNLLLRTAHGVIDIYLTRLMQGPGNLTSKSRTCWLKDFVRLLKKQKGNPGFSTYRELSRLAAHLELIIKNNLPGIFDLPRDEYPRFLQTSLNPVSPIIGASGDTSGRSSQARKFRMPGYPLALVSTDVFQEGEDLHTFCDSVVHYGLSGSPVGIEQKTGRVDRVGSMVQRRLMALDRHAKEEEFIQVTFPHVKQSIEVLQVRQICHNLNAFIESLHDVTANDDFSNDEINLEEALQLKEEVPDQILTELTSPYTADVVEQNEFRAVNEVEKNDLRRNEEIEHIDGLIDKKIKNAAPAFVRSDLQQKAYDIPDDKTIVRLGSAKSSGELLLILRRHADPHDYQLGDRASLLKLMSRISWRAFHRTIAIERADTKGLYQLYFDAEMLVGGPELTQEAEINRLFERMDIEHDPDEYSADLPSTIISLVDSIHEDTVIRVDRSGETKLRVEQEGGVTTLVFELGGAQVHRTQRVRLFASDQRCIFISNATGADYARRLSPQDILRHTWLRNRRIDLVEFVIDSTKALVGRVVHPAHNMEWDEFIYCAYTLAVETDDLEYLLSQEDSH